MGRQPRADEYIYIKEYAHIHLLAFRVGRSCRRWAAAFPPATIPASARRRRPIDLESRVQQCTPTLRRRKEEGRRRRRKAHGQFSTILFYSSSLFQKYKNRRGVARRAHRTIRTLCCVALGASDSAKASVKVAARGKVGYRALSIEAVERAEEG